MRRQVASPPRPLSCDVRFVLLAGVQAFFERDAFEPEEVPDRLTAHLDAAAAQLSLDRP